MGLVTGLAMLAAPHYSRAQAPQEATDLLQAFIRLRAPLAQAIAARDDVIEVVEAQNANRLSLDDIRKIDAQWVAGGQRPLKESLAQNRAGVLLRSFVTRATTMFSEAMLTDEQGALVAAYPTPTDYWQGDEVQFLEPWQSGKLYVGPIGFDRSTQVYAAPIAVRVHDDAGKQIGVLIMGVRLSIGPAE
jgi:hypothetical protein